MPTDGSGLGSPKKCDHKMRYADGKPKPTFRGVLHGILATSLIVGCLALTLGILLDLLPLGHDRWWPMVGFLAGKGASYLESAVFHLYPFRNVKSVSWALKIDLIAVRSPPPPSAKSF